MVMGSLFSYAVLGSAVGVVVGAVEILQRYRDAPFRAVFNGWGVGYVLLNAAVSYGAFWVLYHWIDAPTPDAPGQNDPLHLLGLAAGAGFGGAALIRARLTTIRLPNGQEVGFGPAIAIETLLAVIDRQLDRQLATERYQTVSSAPRRGCPRSCSWPCRACRRRRRRRSPDRSRRSTGWPISHPRTSRTCSATTCFQPAGDAKLRQVELPRRALE